MSENDDVRDPQAEANEARFELLQAIKQLAEDVRIEQVGATMYKGGHTALLALSQAWAALQTPSKD